MIDTMVMAVPIAVSITVLRRNSRQIRGLWRAARWYEKLALCLLFVPIPGPLDELVALAAAERIRRRIKATAKEKL